MGDLVVTCKWSYKERERERESESESGEMVDDEDSDDGAVSLKLWSTHSDSTAASTSWI
jgi:hypothetical protein